MFQELSAKVDKTSYQAAVNKTKELYSLCNSNFAWEFSNIESYKECTDQISESSSIIQKNILHGSINPMVKGVKKRKPFIMLYIDFGALMSIINP